MIRRVRLGVAGLGRMGRLHAENAAASRRIELVRVVDADEGLARRFGNELGTEWSTDYEELLADAEVEGVVVAAPTPLHVSMVQQAASAAKHVLCEKPLAFDTDDAARALAAARAAGVNLQVGFHRRFDPDWSAATERIRNGELGDVYLFRTSLRDMSPPSIEYIRSSGGFFTDVTIHDLDTARWMVGEIEEVTALGAALSDPSFAEAGDVDSALVTLRFANGALGVIDNCRMAGYGYECSTEVVGSKATVRIGSHRRLHTEWLTAGRLEVDWVSDFIERYPQAYRLELEHFADVIRDNVPPLVTGEDGVAALALAQACQRSYEERRPVRIEPAGTAPSRVPAVGSRHGSE
jgi:myo-inositol 2-dehydrogenase/D-chiro-inositol 1-dehydrogenase